MTTTVIGAGIIGLACAYELAERGEDVTVIDGGHVGAAASAGNAGWVTPFLSAPRAAPGALTDALRNFIDPNGAAKMHPHIQAGFVTWALGFLRASRPNRSRRNTYALQQLAQEAIAAYDSLQERGLEFEEHRTGLGVVFQRPENLRNYEQHVDDMRRLGFIGDVEKYQGTQAQSFDPAIAHDVAGALHIKSERHVRPESVTAALAESLLGSGVPIHEHDSVTRIVPGQNGKNWRVVTASGREFESDRVLVAAGFHTAALVKPLGVRVPVEAAKGVSATMHGTGTKPVHALKLFEHMVACSPFEAGLRLSGTFDIGDRSDTINRKRLQMVLQQGEQYFESWHATAHDIEWTGHRPTSADDLPIVGFASEHDGLYIATGHGTLGVTLGPLTGALAAREILDGVREPVLQPFALNRFPRWV